MRQLARNLIRDRAHDRKQQTPANNHSSDPKCVRVLRRRVETCCNWFDFSSTRRSSQHKANERCLRISLGILREWQKQGRRKSETTTLQPPSLSTVPVHRKHANNSKHNRLRRAIFAPHTNGRAKQPRRSRFRGFWVAFAFFCRTRSNRRSRCAGRRRAARRNRGRRVTHRR